MVAEQNVICSLPLTGKAIRLGFHPHRQAGGVQPTVVYPVMGHRIRVTVTSSAKNFIFPNSNTREGFASARTVVAHNRVYHGGLHASRLTVRVEP